MKYAIAAGVAGLASLAQAQVDGFDISHYQETVDYQGAYDSGARFVMIKVRGQSPRKNNDSS